MTAEPALSRRERARVATVEEIKATAVNLMAEQGTTDVRFTDIARAMGMTPPAIYRYFADRDELLTALIADAFDDLGRSFAAARDEAGESDYWARFLGGAQAYRRWAQENPQRFALILGLPVPGYSAPEHGPTTEAARRAMDQLAAIFLAAAEVGELHDPLLRDVHPAMAACAEEKHPALEGLVSAANYQAMVHAWASLHGVTSLEVYGHLDWLSHEAKDALFLGQVRLAARAAGLVTA